MPVGQNGQRRKHYAPLRCAACGGAVAAMPRLAQACVLRPGILQGGRPEQRKRQRIKARHDRTPDEITGVRTGCRDFVGRVMSVLILAGFLWKRGKALFLNEEDCFFHVINFTIPFGRKCIF